MSAPASMRACTVTTLLRSAGDLAARLRLKAGPQREWEELNGFFVPPDQPHAFDASGSTVAMKLPGMEHADDDIVSVAPGDAGEVVWRFTSSGKVRPAP
jgi:uncharacterized cupredoxin-like copper-binding protein